MLPRATAPLDDLGGRPPRLRPPGRRSRAPCRDMQERDAAVHYDLFVAHFVLHDVDRAALPATLVALARSLRPGGRFVVVEPNTESGP